VLEYYARCAANSGVEVVEARSLLMKHDVRFEPVDDKDLYITLEVAIANLTDIGESKGVPFDASAYLYGQAFFGSLREYNSVVDASSMEIIQWYKDVHY
jgi:hypothetical protein